MCFSLSPEGRGIGVLEMPHIENQFSFFSLDKNHEKTLLIFIYLFINKKGMYGL